MTREHEAVDYLLRRGFLSPADVVDESVRVVDTSRRNVSAMVLRDGGAGYVVKHGDGDDSGPVAREARVYELLAAVAAGDRPPIPRLAGWDAEARVLVLGVEPGARSLRAFHVETRSFPAHLASATGDALARLHRLDELLVRAVGCVEAPRILSIHRPSTGEYGSLSRTSLDLVRIVQQSTILCDGLDALRTGWRATAFMHGDLAWGNCVVRPAAGAERVTELHIVDWETAGAGDPCWDTGSVLGEYLAAWVSGMPPERIQPATRALWSTYLRASGIAADAAAESLFRSARYAAARLVQTAVEQAQGSASVDRRAVLLLQLAENVLAQPGRAIGVLLGIDLHAHDAA